MIPALAEPACGAAQAGGGGAAAVTALPAAMPHVIVMPVQATPPAPATAAGLFVAPRFYTLSGCGYDAAPHSP